MTQTDGSSFLMKNNPGDGQRNQKRGNKTGLFINPDEALKAKHDRKCFVGEEGLNSHLVLYVIHLYFFDYLLFLSLYFFSK